MAALVERGFLPSSHLALLTREGAIQPDGYTYLIWDEDGQMIYGVMLDVNLGTRDALLIVEAMDAAQSKDSDQVISAATIESIESPVQEALQTYANTSTPVYKPIVMYVGFDNEGNLESLSELEVEFQDKENGNKYSLAYLPNRQNPTVAVFDRVNQMVPMGDKVLHSPLNKDEIIALGLGQKGYPGELIWPKVFLSFALGKRIGPDDSLTAGAGSLDIGDLPQLTPKDVATRPLGPFLS